jgi:sialate O-acetylesterase
MDKYFVKAGGFAAIWGLAVVVFIANAESASAQPNAGELKLGPLFQDHMVVQRDCPIHVWGKAGAGAIVEVRLGPRRSEAKADVNGQWRVVLEALPAGGPYVLRAVSGKKTAEIPDILVGDVWLCSGQSNMQMTLKESDGGPAAAEASAGLKDVRLATVGRKASANPETSCDIHWRAPAAVASRDFSAVGFYFVATLRTDPALAGVPIGVIDSSFGGSMCEAWIPKEALTKFNPVELRKSMFGIEPSGFFNAMIHPLTRNPIRGAVWYQGEGNAGLPAPYPELLGTLMRSWRERFAVADMPFVVIQLPDWVPGADGLSWAWLREAQAKAVRATPPASLAVGIQTTDGHNLHPREKAEIGRRAALCALRDVYGRPVAASGPIFKLARADGARLRVEFDATDGGLTTRDGRPPRGFAIAGADGKYFYARATIESDSVLLQCESVPSPRTVRYAWSGAPDASLTDRSGLPAAPFRTDTLAPPDIDVQHRTVPRLVRTKAYEVTIDGSGSITSLGVGGKQFLSNALGGAGGTSVPGWLGNRELADVREPGPGQVLCGDSEVEVLLEFAETSMTWTVSNRSSNEINFRIALARQVTVRKQGGADTLMLSRGSASLAITGVVTTSKFDDGLILETPVGARSNKTLSLRVGDSRP